MKDLTVADVIDMVVSGTGAPDERIEQLFEWQHSRDLEIAKWLFGAGASLLIAIAISEIRDQKPFDTVQFGLLVIGPLALFAFGIGKLRAMQRNNRSYLAALKVLGRMSAIKPFLLRYYGRT